MDRHSEANQVPKLICQTSDCWVQMNTHCLETGWFWAMHRYWMGHQKTIARLKSQSTGGHLCPIYVLFMSYLCSIYVLFMSIYVYKKEMIVITPILAPLGALWYWSILSPELAFSFPIAMADSFLQSHSKQRCPCGSISSVREETGTKGPLEKRFGG